MAKNAKHTKLFWLLFFLLLFSAGGCSTFRALFSTEPVGSRSRDGERRKGKKRQNNSGLESRRYNRDPLDALVFRDRRKNHSWAESDLTSAEKDALRYSMEPENSSRREIDRIYLENERSRKKRSEWVFGPNPFRK